MQPALSKVAPDAAGLGSRLAEDPSAGPRDRPQLLGPAAAERLAAEPVERRLRDMGADRIDVQVLSSTRAIQALPADPATDLARRANDRLADTVARHPGRFAALALPF